MDARRESEPTPMKNRTTVERKSERELVVTRTFNGPARIVFEAWTKPELLKRWWAPKSTGVSLHSRLVWTNDESADGAVTTVTFEEKGGKTLLVMRELHPRRKLSTVPSPAWRVG